MFTFSLFWIIFALLFPFLGIPLLRLTRSLPLLDRPADRFVAATWLGIVFLAFAHHTLSLFTSLSPLHGAVLTFCLVLFSLAFSGNREEYKILFFDSARGVSIKLILVLILIVAFWMSFQRTILFDSSDSHFDSIKWLSSYGTVYGLALLITPLGFGSAWYSLQAPLAWSGLSGRYGVILNAFVFVIFLFHFISCFRSVVSKQAKAQDWFILFASPIVFFPLRTDLLTSPSADIPVNFLIVVVCWSILAIASAQKKIGTASGRLLPLLLSVGAVALKLNTIPLLMGSFLFYVFQKTSEDPQLPRSRILMKRFLAGGLLTATVLLPVFAVNFILSGCPAYPSPLFCSDLPWSVGRATALKQAAFLRDFGRWTESDNLSKSHTGFWLWPWVIREKKLAFMILFSMLSSSALWRFARKWSLNKSSTTPPPGWDHVMWTGLIGITFLMVFSPCLRYGWAYTAVIPALAVAVLASKRNINSTRFIQTGFFAVIFLFFIALTIQYTRYGSLTHFKNSIQRGDLTLANTDLAPSFLLPPRLIPISTFAYSTSTTTVGYSAKMESYSRARNNDFDYFRPKNGRCWDVEVPCIHTAFTEDPYENVFLLAPAKGIGGGFRSSVRSH